MMTRMQRVVQAGMAVAAAVCTLALTDDRVEAHGSCLVKTEQSTTSSKAFSDHTDRGLKATVAIWKNVSGGSGMGKLDVTSVHGVYRSRLEFLCENLFAPLTKSGKTTTSGSSSGDIILMCPTGKPAFEARGFLDDGTEEGGESFNGSTECP